MLCPLHPGTVFPGSLDPVEGREWEVESQDSGSW